MEKNILFIEWNSIGNPYIKQALSASGCKVDSYELDRNKVDTRTDVEYTEKLVKALMGKSYYCVFSFNYFPIVAIACKACRIPYVSWTYDSPWIQLFSPTLAYETNFAFIFDNGVCRELAQKGMHTYYLPMAAPMDCYRHVWKDSKCGNTFAGDISFVGSLYNEAHNNMFRHLEDLEPYERGFVDALLHAQKGIYGCNFIESVLKENESVFKQIQKVCPVYARGDGLESAEWTIAHYFLSRKVTSMERNEIMRLLGEKYAVNLYTLENTNIKGVSNRGVVDYNTEAPLVFANSKINLNISLRSIQTGIPLRAFDIMGCGGFLISNYQEDFLLHFEPDEDMVFYTSYEELLDKTEFYLNHDLERKRIAQNAYEKVSKEHTYLQRVNTMLSTVEEYWG